VRCIEEDKLRRETVICDSCDMEIDNKYNVYSIHINNGRNSRFMELCAACVKYQRLPLTTQDWERFNGKNTK
jgi:hypothetical protein